MPWIMTNAEKREEKRLNRAFKRKYGKKKKVKKLIKKHKTKDKWWAVNYEKDMRWRAKVLRRDNYQCKHCSSKEELNAHHIKGKNEYPHLRYKLSNGITLCINCHDKIHDGLINYIKLRDFQRDIMRMG